MQVNELSTATFTVVPIDITGSIVAPSNARYRLDDTISGNALIAWTTIATPSIEMKVSIPASIHSMVDASLSEESKKLTVETDFGTNNAHVEEFEYFVRNLQFVS